jgi:aspartyl protease family protein
MRAELAASVAVVVAAIVGVRYFEMRAPVLAATTALASPPAPTHYAAAYAEEVRIKAAHDHQYYVTAAVNDAPSSFLVDTGAGFVAIRDSDARKAGVNTAWTDYTQAVRTANGETKAALVTIAAIEIGGIRVENVKAFVLADDQLSVNLLGMSFLSQLESVEARKGELVLRG